MHTPSKYQSAIYSFIKEEKGNLLIEAVAGAGKTTTLVEIAGLTQKETLIVCFNKHTALSLQERIPMNAKACTLNSLGYSIMRDNNLRAKIDTWKTSNAFKSIAPKEHKQQFAIMNQVISLTKAEYDGYYFPSLEQIVEKYGIGEELDETHFHDVLQTCNLDNKVIDFDDQIIYPIYKQMRLPTHYKFILIDEAQDLNRAQFTLLQKIAEQNIQTRIIAVGDPAQSIYGFRGADSDSMDNLREKFGCSTLPLSVSYRCAKSIVERAKIIYPTIECWEDAQEGTVSTIDISEFNPQVNDTVLCRTNAPLMQECIKQVKAGKLSIIKGDDIEKSLKKLIKKAGKLETDVKEYSRKQEWDKMSKKKRIATQDMIDMLFSLIRYAKEINSTLDSVIDSLFGIERRPHILFCSIHKAKGLEWDTVYIIRPDLLPHPYGDEIEEKNIAYVAVTRAKKNLVFVTEEEV